MLELWNDLQSLQEEARQDKEALARLRQQEQQYSAQIKSLQEEAGKGKEYANKFSNQKQESEKLKQQQQSAAKERDDAIKKRSVIHSLLIFRKFSVLVPFMPGQSSCLRSESVQNTRVFFT